MMDLFLTPFLYPMKPLNNASAQLGVERKDVRVILTNKRDSGSQHKIIQMNAPDCVQDCNIDLEECQQICLCHLFGVKNEEK